MMTTIVVLHIVMAYIVMAAMMTTIVVLNGATCQREIGYTHVYGHVYRHVYGHVYGNVYGHVYGHASWQLVIRRVYTYRANAFHVSTETEHMCRAIVGTTQDMCIYACTGS